MRNLVFFLTLFSWLTACNNTKTIKLVTDGESPYTIVIPSHANEQENRAALLLQKYIKQISGCEIPVDSQMRRAGKGIFIREVSGLQYDGYRMKCSENGAVFIDGGKRKGCVYGVVTLLEDYLGCHVYSPTFKVVPQCRNIFLPIINQADSSVNNYRIVNYFSGSYAGDEDLLDWNRLSKEYIFASHSFDWLVPWETYYKTHPEYYALRDGKRLPTQLCLTNKAVLTIAVDKLRKAIAGNPKQIYWSVAQNDYGNPCQCENCLKIEKEEKSQSGPIIRFANQVAREFPDKMICTYAYNYSQSPPAITKPVDNVHITLCSIETDRSRPIATDSAAAAIQFVNDIAGWGKIGRHIATYDYTINYHHFISPHPNLFVLQPNIQLFVKNNVFDHYQQSDIAEGHEFVELRLHLIAKLLWNPNIGVSATMDQFLNNFYGAAAPWIRKYIDQLQNDLVRSGDRLNIFGPPSVHQDTYLTALNLEKYGDFFDNAEAAVKNDTTFLHHVEVARLPLSYAILEIGKANIVGPRGWWDSTGTVKSEKMVALLEKLHEVMKREKIGVMSEHNLTPKDYYEMTRQTADKVFVAGNLAFRKKVTSIPAPGPLNKYNKGDLSLLTDGGIGDLNKSKPLWIGWEEEHLELLLDLDTTVIASSIELTTLLDTKARRILHPSEVTCLVSGKKEGGFVMAGKTELKGNQLNEQNIRTYRFPIRALSKSFRYVKFKITGTKVMPSPYPTVGQKAQLYIGEITVNK
jgi:hypothetical protein